MFNETICKLFERTVDAQLVSKWLGGQIKRDPVEFIKLNGKQKEILAEAQRLEAQDVANKNVVRAQIVSDNG